MGTVCAGLVALAILGAAVLAYGIRASLGRYDGGVEIIVLVRRLQWLLVGLSLIACMSLVTLVIANRASVWWLLGLPPVLVLLAARFGPSPGRYVIEVDAQQFSEAWHPAAPGADEWVVGVTFEDRAYAFPFRALHVTPIVALTDYDKRMLLMWSPHANRARAVTITRDLRPRALEIVSTPADALLVNHRRYGQFISSISGRLVPGGGDPIGFAQPIELTKTTWGAWRAAHPETGVLLLARDGGEDVTSVPGQPLAPRAELPPRATTDAPRDLRVAMIETNPPLAIPSDLIGREPLNLAGGAIRLLVLRDPATGAVRAFDRRASEDLFPIFTRHHDGRDPTGEAELIDSDTHSRWTYAGRAVGGPLAGEQLKPVAAEDGLYWGVMKHWYPELQLVR